MLKNFDNPVIETISLKLPVELNRALELQAQQRGLHKSQLMRQILETYLQENTQAPSTSLLDNVADTAGVLNGPVDLSSNPEHLDGYGE